jgi:hypothetical protein
MGALKVEERAVCGLRHEQGRLEHSMIALCRIQGCGNTRVCVNYCGLAIRNDLEKLSRLKHPNKRVLPFGVPIPTVPTHRLASEKEK